MRVIIVGAGIIGVATAHCLAEAGCEVTVLDRCAGVAQECSFANAGVIAPGYVTPWAAPGMPRKVLSALFRTDAPVRLRARFDWSQWAWIVRWLAECRAERYRVNKERMQRVAYYSRAQLHEWRDRLELDYEQSQGYLQLFRTEADRAMAEPAIAMLREGGVTHQLLTPEQCRQREPGLGEMPFAGGLYLPDDEVGNCAQFARQLRQVAERNGASFKFQAKVDAIQSDAGEVEVRAGERYRADAVVLAAGIDSRKLLSPLGVKLPLYAVKGYSATMPIRETACAPRSALMDEALKVAVSRLGNRIRVAGTAELGGHLAVHDERALRTLIRVVGDWFPGGADVGRATYWGGLRPMLPDGAPIIGPSGVARVFLNLGHGSTGWAMACGAGRVCADVVLGRTPEIDLSGLTLDRYRKERVH